jgi:hypothetical protein
MQLMRAPASIAGTDSRPISIPNSTTVYHLDNQGRALVAEADIPYLQAHGFSPVKDIHADLFANSGVIASGTGSIGLGILPANYFIEHLILQELAGNAITGGINIGSSAGGNDIVSALAITANLLTAVAGASILKRVFSTTAPTGLFVSAVTSWNGASLNCKAVLRPF